MSGRRTTLRVRIAASYAGLLIGIIAFAALALNFGFRGLLYEQARARVDRTADEIARAVGDRDPLVSFSEGASGIGDLITQSNLEHWSSPTTAVQIDNSAGYPIGKSANLGKFVIPADSAIAGRAAKATAAEQPISYRSIETPLGSFLVLDRVLRFPNKTAVIVHVAESLAIVDATLRTSRIILLVTVLVALPLVTIAAFLIAGGAVRPIHDLAAAMREIGSDHLDRRLGWTRGDEIGDLAATFDAMLERLELAFERERQFISDASHELKTPLTIINANAQMLSRWADNDPEVRRESLAAITSQSASLAAMINGMLMLAKADAGDKIPKEPVALDAVLDALVHEAKPRAAERGLELTFTRQPDTGHDCASAPVVFGDAGLLRQLFSNLIDNAIKFTQAGSITVGSAVDRAHVFIEVRDTGAGIDENARERVFDRFFRGDPSRSRLVEGTGLGLAIVRSIAGVHGGTVEARGAPGKGTTMRVTLPRHDAAAPGAENHIGLS